jgi:hypothetical protein
MPYLFLSPTQGIEDVQAVGSTFQILAPLVAVLNKEIQPDE